jgi:molecular chaperone DnaK
MTRTTIDYGIDLGTTNSCVSVAENSGAVIIRNNEGWPYTPSAVYVEKDGSVRTGRAAKGRLISHPSDAVGGFKRWMGTAQTKTFLPSGLTMTAEQLSAEVLKELREQVKQKRGEDLEAAVITVPASFDWPASEATGRAAALAGFASSPLLQEPIAAALGYSFRETRKSSFWLVYDIGGGTFDAAVIQVRDGEVQVVNHGGDNHLGGEDVDLAIVDKFFVPHLTAEYALTDFRVGNEKWRAAFAKLMDEAEKAKIAVSKERSESVQRDFLCFDDAERPVELDFLLSRADVESVFRPLLYRSIDLCRRVLSEAKLAPSHIERIILVGGPTYTPCLREILPDPKEGLGIPVDFSADPMTVVAQGAAIFAASKRLMGGTRAVAGSGAYTLLLSYDPVGNDAEPLVAGSVTGPSKRGLAGFSIRFANPDAKPPWKSGRIPLDAAGGFSCSLIAQEGETNQFRIELFDPNGRPCMVTPSSLNYTIGLTIKAAPLTHNIGIAEAGNKIHVVFTKGTPLPAKTTAKHMTVGLVRHGNSADSLKIPWVEGEATEAADENRKIGEFKLIGTQIDRDLPSGSDVEIRIEVNESRHVKARFYIPVLDLEAEISMVGLVKTAHPVDDIQEQFQKERDALAKNRELAQATKSKDALNELDALNRQELIQGIDRMLRNQSTDVDLITCEEQVVALRRARRRIEVLLSARKMHQEAQDETRWSQGLLEQVGTEEDRRSFVELKRQVENALSADPETLRKAIDGLSKFRVQLWRRTPEYWLGYREYLAGEKDKMPDSMQADRWLVHAYRAIASGDMEALKSACSQLHALLPRQEQTGYGGTTIRAR